MPLIIELSLLTCVMASLTILQVPVDEWKECKFYLTMRPLLNIFLFLTLFFILLNFSFDFVSIKFKFQLWS